MSKRLGIAVTVVGLIGWGLTIFLQHQLKKSEQLHIDQNRKVPDTPIVIADDSTPSGLPGQAPTARVASQYTITFSYLAWSCQAQACTANIPGAVNASEWDVFDSTDFDRIPNGNLFPAGGPVVSISGSTLVVQGCKSVSSGVVSCMSSSGLTDLPIRGEEHIHKPLAGSYRLLPR